MNKVLSGGLILAVASLLMGCKPDKTFTQSELALIPQPREIMLGESSFRFRKGTRLVVENVEQKLIAVQFSESIQKSTGWKLETIVGGDEGANQVYFRTEPMMGPEAYLLDVSPKRIEIKAAKPAGFFYALQTLRQLLPIEIESTIKQSDIDWVVPVISISDQPAFRWRGFMLDVSRHFFPKEDVLKMIDNMALHKLNTLHLHLTDDQGWRIEIKKYPKLTEVGAWRVDHEDKHWNARPKQQEGEKATYGGFYTQEEIKEMIAYAQKRFITIVPEIEMPAHVTAALAAYPHLSCTRGPFTVLPGGVWPITDIYCAGKDTTFLFLEDVLREVIDLFPSRYIHIGGDEATKTEWEKCPLCRQRMKIEGLQNVGELQSYFIQRIERFINSKGRILLGWDEIIEGGLPAQATVMSWRGFEGGIEAASQGHDVVMTPTDYCYFDYYQGPKDQEPLSIGGYVPLKKVYNFNPVPEGMSNEAARHILGAQANLWTEYIGDIKHAEYMAFPRLAAMAEVLWSPKEVRGWEDFSRRLQQFMNRYEKAGINYAKSSYKVSSTTYISPEEKNIEVRLMSELDRAEIHYTLDGSEPSTLASIYAEPIIINKSTVLKAATFINGQPAEQTMMRLFEFNKATFKPVRYIIPTHVNYQGSGDITLVNGMRGSTDHADNQWQGWLDKRMEVIIELKDTMDIKRISVGTLLNTEARIYSPQMIEYFVSTDGVQFQKVSEVVNDPDAPSSEALLKNYAATIVPVKASYVRIVAHNMGPVPAGHPGEGEPAWIFMDEIAVE